MTMPWYSWIFACRDLGDLAELLRALDEGVRFRRLLDREDAVHHGLETPHEHELHHLLELPLVCHRGAEDGELSPEHIPQVDLGHWPRRGPRDDDTPALPERPNAILERRLAHVVQDHVHPAFPRE